MLSILFVAFVIYHTGLCSAFHDDIILSEKVSVTPSASEKAVIDEYLEPPKDDNLYLSNQPASRVVGGQETTIEKYPHQVSFIVNNSYFCGGFIVSEHYILTAAHCAQNVDPKTVVLRAGSTWRRKGTIIPIAEVIPHPKYNQPFLDNDVAVMKTVDSMTFSETMLPIELPPLGRIIEKGKPLKVSGWGRTKHGSSPIPERLLDVQLPTLSHSRCKRIYEVLTKNEFCAGQFSLGRKGTCQGDSGGAATQDGMAVGIVSYGRGCGKPSVFAYIAAPSIRNFITKHTGL